MFNRTECPACHKKLSEKKMLTWNGDHNKYCPKCFETLANTYIETTYASQKRMAEDNLTLTKRLKNKGARMWVIMSIKNKKVVKSGVIRNRTEEEVGLRFVDDEILREFDEPSDEITLFYAWKNVYLDEFSAQNDLAAYNITEGGKTK